jgi:hypothetical protein
MIENTTKTGGDVIAKNWASTRPTPEHAFVFVTDWTRIASANAYTELVRYFLSVEKNK